MKDKNAKLQIKIQRRNTLHSVIPAKAGIQLENNLKINKR